MAPAVKDAITWLVTARHVIAGYFLYLDDCPLYKSPKTLSLIAAYALIFFSGLKWARLVDEYVPKPYMDEVFHIPQAQAYCDARYDVWDPKLTTPPGLYGFAVAFVKIFKNGSCSTSSLRSFNSVALAIILSYSIGCRQFITKSWKGLSATKLESHALSPDIIHTAINIALFPPLFFFTGLFYTDVLSTCVVLRMYRLFLGRKGPANNSSEGLLWLYLTGTVALLMRQTNIFWVAIFMGGLEAVRSIKSNAAESKGARFVPRTWKEWVGFEFERYSRGEIHDPVLGNASVQDFILCITSITVAILFHPLLVLRHLWPYISLLVTFAGFVSWNGGVVLGDKSNHVATIHLPQLLYLLAFIAFFSLPLLLQPILTSLWSTVRLLQLPLFPRLRFQYVLVTGYLTLALLTTLAVIRYNTIIHPFTLADNRHYMFYIFRYSILRHWAIRYLLAPIYLVCGWGAYLTLCSPSPTNEAQLTPKARTTPSKPSSNINKKPKPDARLQSRGEVGSGEGATVSTLVILLLTTAVSLITAPLVEPRYFILPWVMWRLHVPPLPSPSTSIPTPSASPFSYVSTANPTPNIPPLTTHQPNQQPNSRAPPNVQPAIQKWINYCTPRGHDYRLYLETAWFLVLNAVTGYIFLRYPFTWPHDPGHMQRFMW